MLEFLKSIDETVYMPVLISMKIAIVATVITAVLGTALGLLFVRKDFPGKDIFEVLITLPMVMPPSVTGYILLLIIGKKGFVGRILQNVFDINLIFTWQAACIAAAVVSLPLMYQSCKSAFMSVDRTYENAARTLGANEWTVFSKVTLPLAWPGLVSGLVLSFARALGEFGATLMVAGNIPGKTENIPIATYFAVESNNMEKANFLMLVVVFFSFITIFSLNKWLRSRRFN